RSFAGGHPAHTPAISIDSIGAGQEAHDLNGLERGGPGIYRIGSHIADNVRSESENSTVGIECELRIDNFVECLRGGEKVFQAVARPSDRTLEMASESTDQDFLRIKRAFAAEPSAHIFCDDTDAVTRNFQEVGE